MDDGFGRHPWTIADAATPEECARLIERIDSSAPWALRTLTDAGLLRRVTARIEDALAARESARTCTVRMSDDWYVKRYEPGESIGVHMDGTKKDAAGAASVATFLLYLNDCADGGHTCFVDSSVDGAFALDPVVTGRVTPPAQVLGDLRLPSRKLRDGMLQLGKKIKAPADA